LLILSLPACATSPLEERLAEPDVRVPNNCAVGDRELEVSGTLVDFTTGLPVAGARIDLTEAFSAASPSFPKTGCRIGGTTTDAEGRFGPLMVRAVDTDPTLVFLVTGAGRAPTAHDASIGCLFSCYLPPQTIAAPTHELTDAWREDLYAGGMEYALNRGLVAYKFHDSAGRPASGVKPVYKAHLLADDQRLLDPGSEVRFVEPDRQTLALPDRASTTTAGVALIGGTPDAKGYFRVGGERGTDWWASVNVITATGWIHVESDTVDER
jgi:hypothetical protein